MTRLLWLPVNDGSICVPVCARDRFRKQIWYFFFHVEVCVAMWAWIWHIDVHSVDKQKNNFELVTTIGFDEAPQNMEVCMMWCETEDGTLQAGGARLYTSLCQLVCYRVCGCILVVTLPWDRSGHSDYYQDCEVFSIKLPSNIGRFTDMKHRNTGFCGNKLIRSGWIYWRNLEINLPLSRNQIYRSKELSYSDCCKIDG